MCIRDRIDQLVGIPVQQPDGACALQHFEVVVVQAHRITRHAAHRPSRARPCAEVAKLLVYRRVGNDDGMGPVLDPAEAAGGILEGDEGDRPVLMELRSIDLRKVPEYPFGIEPVGAQLVQLIEIRCDRLKRADVARDTLAFGPSVLKADAYPEQYGPGDRALLGGVVRNTV